MKIAVTNLQRTRKINRLRLKEIVNALLKELAVADAEISICLAAAPEMMRLNKNFLRHAGSTDVITFDYHVNGGTGWLPPAGGAPGAARPAVHGEILVCVDEAVAQARKFGTSWQSEIVRYIVHGALHLTGHDDQRPAARRQMKRVENRLVHMLSRRFSLAQLSRPARLSA